MAYTDTPEDFDINIFMQAMGYDVGYIGEDQMMEFGLTEDICLWSDRELTFITREDNQMMIKTSELYSADVQHDLDLGRATLLKEYVPERLPMNDPVNNPRNVEYSAHLVELLYRVPWPTTFNTAVENFGALGWFGKMPAPRMQLMERYEALALAQAPVTSAALVVDLGDEQSIHEARETLRRFRH